KLSASQRPLARLKSESLPPINNVPIQRLAGAGGLWRWSSDPAVAYSLKEKVLTRLRLPQGTAERSIALPGEGSFVKLLHSQAGLVAVSQQPTRLWVIDPDKLELLRVVETPDLLREARNPIESISASPASPLLATATLNDGVELIDLTTGDVAAS